MVASIKNLNFDEGDDFPYVITVTDENGNAVDLTGYTFYFTIKKNINDSDGDAIFKKTVTSIPSPELGIVTITLDRNDTFNVPPGSYPYDIKYYTGAGKTRTLLRGLFNIIQGVTDEVS